MNVLLQQVDLSSIGHSFWQSPSEWQETHNLIFMQALCDSTKQPHLDKLSCFSAQRADYSVTKGSGKINNLHGSGQLWALDLRTIFFLWIGITYIWITAGSLYIF